jgi:hypothetical protein
MRKLNFLPERSHFIMAFIDEIKKKAISDIRFFKA